MAAFAVDIVSVQWMLDVLGDPDMTDQDSRDAFSALLNNTTQSFTKAAAAAAAAAAGGGHLAQLLSAEQRMREMYVQLQPSREDKLQFRALMQQLSGLQQGDPRVGRLITDCKVGVGAVAVLRCWHARSRWVCTLVTGSAHLS
jgi:hypothetical protein